ncbi:FAD-dependent oxidoreductase [Dethiosulfatarculus sandiegensis]|uniref:Pyridine nucleotide-disulfide oxidoreductase n=1 Tax=Dethiosulfatarculus sandiegensis TaxID=1429043 RepID=A0A0D2J089_9BACT|nr:FAD-dependent oxidoreductase [Dethiosulfatarculus sandiegensis]KIX11649.1 pyridine nucleotide-disulfide oxidoreductase [Dethiosulfatarculus sandiegensis]
MSMRVVIVGGVAAGPKAACRIKRLMPEAKVTMVDRDSLISYGGCGIPYYVGGDVADLEGLLSTSFHMVRDANFFTKVKGLEVLTRTEVTRVDPQAKEVWACNLDTGEEMSLPYDKLVLATGSIPFIPPVPGKDLNNVVPVANLHHAKTIKEMVSQGQVGTAVIVGAGATGLEMAEAMADLWGIEVHIVEAAPQFLPGLADPQMARMLEIRMAEQEDIHLHLGASLEEVLDDGQGNACGVIAGGEKIESDVVIMGCGVRPNTSLAAEASLDLNQRGAILVDDHMCTSDPDIYAGGDCVSIKSMITGEGIFMPAGSLANREGRVIGTNIAGGDARFPGASGSFCIKLFGLSLARTGLNELQAKEAGFAARAVIVAQADRAHFHPDQKMMFLKLVVNETDRRILGLTAVGENGDAVVGRVNAVAGLLAAKATLEDLSNLELAYSPPLGAAVDVLNSAANAAENLLEGRLEPLAPEEFIKRLRDPQGSNTVFIDTRAFANAEPFLEAFGDDWVNIPQETLRERWQEVPKDKNVVLVCNSGVRSYESQLILKAKGYTNTVNLGGGMATMNRWAGSVLPSGDKE